MLSEIVSNIWNFSRTNNYIKLWFVLSVSSILISISERFWAKHVVSELIFSLIVLIFYVFTLYFKYGVLKEYNNKYLSIKCSENTLVCMLQDFIYSILISLPLLSLLLLSLLVGLIEFSTLNTNFYLGSITLQAHYLAVIAYTPILLVVPFLVIRRELGIGALQLVRECFKNNAKIIIIGSITLYFLLGGIVFVGQLSLFEKFDLFIFYDFFQDFAVILTTLKLLEVKS